MKPIRNFFIPNENNNFYPKVLRKKALTVYTLFLVLFNVTFGFLIPSDNSRALASSITSENLINLTNQERANFGLNQLSTNAQLTAAAHAKAQNMFEEDYWDHFGPNGETPWQFILAAGYDYVYAGENLAKGFTSSEGVHQAWMASPTHKANIISGNYQEIGIAVVEGTLQGEEVILVVQMFGSKENVTYTPNDVAGETDPVEVSTPIPVEESGEIKSISITFPGNNSTLTNPSQVIRGNAEIEGTIQGSYHVYIKEGEVEILEADSTDNSWEVKGKSDWEEGEHEIVASVDTNQTGGKEVTSLVAFTVDSEPPDVSPESVGAVLSDDGDVWTVSVEIPEENIESVLSVGDQTYAMSVGDGGKYSAEVPDSGVSNASQVLLLVSDQSGNTHKVDITAAFLKGTANANETTKSEDGFSFTAFFGGFDVKTVVNLSFAFILMIILGIQVYQYRKRKMLSERGGYLFTIGLWVFLIAAAGIGSLSGNVL